MRKLKKLSMAVLLTVMLATGAFAGIIQTPEPPPAPPDSSSAVAPDPAVAPTTSADQQVPAAGNSVVDVALNLAQIALSVF